MSTVFFNVGTSLDGYLAPAGMVLDAEPDPANEDWMALRGKMQDWMFHPEAFRQNLQLGAGGETGSDNQLLLDLLARTGVSIVGKRMFEGGERFWPEEAPFHTPVFVLTSEGREPWVRPGGTTFHFVNDGIYSALRQVREAASGRDIRIAGGADTIVQDLNAGLVDEFTVSVAPVMFGGGSGCSTGSIATLCTSSRSNRCSPRASPTSAPT